MSTKGKLAWGWVVVVCLLHHDFWYWDDATLVLGFLPVGLWWHLGISLGAGLGWFLVVRWAWPAQLEEWAAQRDGAAAGGEASGREAEAAR